MNTNQVTGGAALSRKRLPEFQQALEARWDFHRVRAERHVCIFKPLGFLFGLAIPILAALVTFSLSDTSGIPPSVQAAMGLGLTLLTIVNSVLKPDERFAKEAQNCIALNDWKLDFDIKVAEADPADEAAFHAMIQQMDAKLSEIGKAMAQGWIPKPTT